MSTVPNLGCRKLEEKAKQNVLLEMNGWQVRPCIQIRLRSCLFLVFHYFLLVFSRSKLDDFSRYFLHAPHIYAYESILGYIYINELRTICIFIV
jgi:hypothetical protein